MEAVEKAALAALAIRAGMAQGTPVDSGSGKSTLKRIGAGNGLPADPKLRIQEILDRARAREEAMTPEERAVREQKLRDMHDTDRRVAERKRREYVLERIEESGVPEAGRVRVLSDLAAYEHQEEARQIIGALMDELRGGGRDWWLVLQGERRRVESNPGANGIGKSALAMAATIEACQDGKAAQYWPESRLSREVFGRLKRPGELSDLIDSLGRVALLVLDNMGTDGDFTARGVVAPVSEFLRSQLFDVMDTRMEAPRPVIITTNLMPDEFESRYGHDIYSRVYGMTARRGTWVRFYGPDLRKEWR